MYSCFSGIALCAALLLGSAALHAEDIRIPIGQQAQGQALAVPSTGMKKAEVEARFGTPQAQTPPVGQPPISRWTYAEFVVYFEYDHVVRSVKMFTPQHPNDATKATDVTKETAADTTAP